MVLVEVREEEGGAVEGGAAGVYGEDGGVVTVGVGCCFGHGLERET